MARELQPCGTVAAYQRHRVRGEQACAACLEAWRMYQIRRRGGYKELPPPQPCGTVAAYVRHRNRGEDACQACLQAWAAYKREYRAKGRKA